MRLEPVQSSNIVAVGHDAETSKLFVQFKSGGTYQYDNVPPEAHAAFVGAESVGKHFHAEIKGKYEGSKYDGPVEMGDAS